MEKIQDGRQLPQKTL